MSRGDGTPHEDTQTRTFEVPGGALAAVEIAPPQPRGTALLVPGYSGSKEDFAPLLPLLAAAGWHAVALDLRGQLDSPGPADPAAYAVEALAVDVVAVLEQLEAPVHLVGHSFGGLVSRAAALRSPHLLAGLTLMGSGPAALVGPRVEVLRLLPQVLADGGTVAVADAAQALGDADPAAAAVPESVRAFLRRRWLAASPTGLVAMAEALLTEPDRVADLRASGVPVLVVHGEADDAWPPALQADMAGRLGAAYEVVPGARHSPAVEAPEPTAKAMLAFWG